MSLRLQEKLLRVVEYGEFERVGSSETIKVNIRLIGAANVDLPSMARAGKFREDLLDRLSFDVITVPPLRERRDDIILLAQKFAEGMRSEEHTSELQSLMRISYAVFCLKKKHNNII